MKKLILTFLPVVFATVLNAQITASEMVTNIASGNKFTRANQWSGDALHRVPDLSKASSSGDLFFCDSVYGYMFNQLNDSSLDYKNIYSYDVNGNQSTYTQYMRDNTSNQWIIMMKDTTAYISKDKLAFRRMLSWDTNTKKISGGWGFDNTFDANGNQIKNVEYEMDIQNNQFVYSRKAEKSYNSTGVMDSALNYDWDPFMGNWKITSKWVSTYDLENILKLSIHYNWDAFANQWINFQKTDFGHDSTGNLNFYMNYNWDDNDSQWIKADSFEIIYNEFGYATLMSHYNWDVNAALWVGTWKTEDIYDGQENRVTSISYQWNMTDNQWVYNYKYDESYDANGNVVLRLFSWYDITNNEWASNSIDEYYYDENGLTYLSVYSSFIDDQWYLGSKYYSYNSIHVLTDLVKPAMSNSLAPYPNPAIECINIRSVDPLSNLIQLYNYNGQLLKTVTIEHGLNTINISNLEPGLYFFKILSKQPSETYKFIKIE